MLSALARFRRADRGMAAVEFALLLPVIVLIYIGAGELSQSVMTSRKVASLSRTLADLVSQQSTTPQIGLTPIPSTPAPANATTQVALQTILGASTAIMTPAATSTLKMTVSAVDIVNNGAGLCCSFRVRWSYTQGGTLRPCGVDLTPVDPAQTPSPATVSNAMVPPVLLLTSPVPIVIADVSYTFVQPLATQWINFTSGTQRTSYMLPRATGAVILAGPIAAAANQSGVICY